MFMYAYLGVLWAILIAVHTIIFSYGKFDAIAYATGFAVVMAVIILDKYFPNLKKSVLFPGGLFLLFLFAEYCEISGAVYGTGVDAALVLLITYKIFGAKKKQATETACPKL